MEQQLINDLFNYRNLFILFITIIIAIGFYYKHRFNYWTRLGIHGPTFEAILKPVLAFTTKPVHIQQVNEYNKYGKKYPFYGSFFDGKPMIYLSDLQLIKQILVKDFHVFSHNNLEFPTNNEIAKKFIITLQGEDWKRVRNLVTPTFTVGKMKKIYGTIRTCVDGYIEKLGEIADTKMDADLKYLNSCLTLNTIAKCGFAADANAFKDPNSMFVKMAFSIFSFSIMNLVGIIFGPLLPEFLQKYFSLPPADTIDYFKNLVMHLKKERQGKDEQYNDFFQIMTDALKQSTEDTPKDLESESHYNLGDQENFEKRDKIKKLLDDDELVAQSIIFIAGGHETTSTALSNTMYNLALNQEAQKNLHKEIMEAFSKSHDGEIAYEDLLKLPYLDAVISEALRLVPPFFSIERKNAIDYRLGEDGPLIKKDTPFCVPMYALHHDPELFPEPLAYKPERFLPENRDNIMAFSYLPFSAGPRNCPGLRFGLLEVKLALSHVIKNFRLFPSQSTDNPLKLVSFSGLLQVKSFIIAIEKRN